MNITLISNEHQRYEHKIPVHGRQYCKRAIKIESKNFCEFFPGMPVNPKSGLMVTMFNMDVPNPNGSYNMQMQPKLMELVSDTGSQMQLKGIMITSNGMNAGDFRDYGITLHLQNRNVIKCTLHIYSRGVDIEYFDIE